MLRSRCCIHAQGTPGLCKAGADSTGGLLTAWPALTVRLWAVSFRPVQGFTRSHQNLTRQGSKRPSQQIT